MKFLPHRKAENTMLVNVIYHSARRETNYVDYLDIIYKDIPTGKKYVETIEKPEVDIYFVKKEYQDFDYNQSFFELDKTDKHSVQYNSIPFYIAKQVGGDYYSWVMDRIKSGERRHINNMHRHPHVFGSDYEIENWYRIQWLIHNDNNSRKPISKQFVDIEVDSIDAPGFPRNGDYPINAITIVDQESMTCFTFLLRNNRNPQIQEFEDDIESFIDELHEAFDETYGKLEYRIYMYDEDKEDRLLVDFFKLIHTLKRDFLLIWNGLGFDIPYIIDRLKQLGLDAVDIMTHKDFKLREFYYKKDYENFTPETKSDSFKISSYTVWSDQMMNYAGLRKGRGELRSYSLNAIAQEEIDDEKLDYSEDANIKTLPYVDYKKFVMYNIKDVLLQLGIENKTQDIENVYLRAYSNATCYEKIFRQTVFLKNRAYVEYYNQGFIIGNNANIDYSIDPKLAKEMRKKRKKKEEKFDGAVVADPELNSHTGIMVFGSPSMYIYDNSVDEDFSSMYPNEMISFNIAPNCMLGKLIIDRKYVDILNDIEGEKEDLGKDFIENFLVGNVGTMGSKWFGLPSFDELHEMLREKLDIKDHRKINISDHDTYYLQKITI